MTAYIYYRIPVPKETSEQYPIKKNKYFKIIFKLKNNHDLQVFFILCSGPNGASVQGVHNSLLSNPPSRNKDYQREATTLKKLNSHKYWRLFAFSILVMIPISSMFTGTLTALDQSINQLQATGSIGMKVRRFESSHSLGALAGNGDFVNSITDMYFCWSWHSSVLPAMHEAGKTVLVYRNIQSLSIEGGLFQMALDNNWALIDSNGNYVREQGWPEMVLMDAGSESYRQFHADKIRDRVADGFDGIFADNAISAYIQTQWMLSSHPINPRTGQLYTDQEWFDDRVGLINYIKEEVPEAKIISNGMIFNGYEFYKTQQVFENFLSQANMDAVFMEGIFNNFGTLYSETNWVKSVNLVKWMQNNYLDDPNKILVLWSSSVWGFPSSITKDQMATFIFTSSLLGVTRVNQNYISLHGYMDSETAQELFNIKLGSSLEDYHILEGTHLYEREFTNARVIVNPVGTPYSINLEGSYLDMNDNLITQITLSGYSGTILTPVS